MSLNRITQRPDYLKIAATKRRWVTPTMLVQYMPPKNQDNSDLIPPAIGFTVTKKVGNAVIRNRMRRRLKDAASRLLPNYGQQGARYVLVGREGGIDASFDKILKDLRWALEKLKKNADLNTKKSGADHDGKTKKPVTKRYKKEK